MVYTEALVDFQGRSTSSGHVPEVIIVVHSLVNGVPSDLQILPMS